MDRFEAKRLIGNDFNTCISMAEESFVDEASEEEGRNETKEERLLRVMDIRKRVRSVNVRRTMNRVENDWLVFNENGYLPVVRGTQRDARQTNQFKDAYHSSPFQATDK